MGHIPYIRPWAYIQMGGGLINRVIIKLRTAWTYKQGDYTWGIMYGFYCSSATTFPLYFFDMLKKKEKEKGYSIYSMVK